jgi:twinkle protein
VGKVIQQTLCPNPACDSSNAFTVYADDAGKVKDATCFSCGYWTKDQAIIDGAQHGLKAGEAAQSLSGSDQFGASPSSHGSYSTAGGATSSVVGNKQPLAQSMYEQKVGSIDECLLHPVRELKDRCISHATCEKYGVRVGVNTRDGVTPVYHLYPYYRDNELVGFKQKITATKSFQAIGDCKNSQLFGSHCINPSGKKLFITEGELDALALYQALKDNSGFSWEPAVISLPNGAKSAVKSISENLDLINSYEEIILVFDNDASGKEAAKDVCKILAGKVFTVRLTEKDANAMLMKGKGTDLKWAVLTGAKKFQPDGILAGADCWERYKHSSNTESYPYPSTMSELNDKTYGCRSGTIVTVTSGSGSGKSQFLREIKYHYFKTTDFKIADIALEEDVGDTVGGMLSLHLNKRITLPDVQVTEQEEKGAFDEIYGSNRITLYDFFGGMDDDNLFSKLRYFASTGHKLIFLDHLSIIVSEYASEGGERERIDTIMTKLAKFVKETGCILFLVVHLRKADGHRSFEEGAVPSLDDLRGSGAIKQLSWDVIGLSRNQQHTNPMCANTTELSVLKCRFTGRTGTAGYLYFDDTSGRMLSTSEPVGYREYKR